MKKDPKHRVLFHVQIELLINLDSAAEVADYLALMLREEEQQGNVFDWSYRQNPLTAKISEPVPVAIDTAGYEEGEFFCPASVFDPPLDIRSLEFLLSLLGIGRH